MNNLERFLNGTKRKSKKNKINESVNQIGKIVDCYFFQLSLSTWLYISL